MDENSRTPPALPGNLSVVLSSFIGRRGETAELAAALEGHRLVSVIGPAGIGKTRLAIEVARRVHPKFPGGAWFVDLSIASRPNDVPRLVAASVSARDVPQGDVVSSLLTQLRPHPLLLILDNCEHVLGSCAWLVGTLLGTCPRLYILCTSREPMGVPGEFVRRLDGLPVLGAANDSDRPPRDDAVHLFLDRAADTGTPATTPLDPAVVEICRRLDGVPLAIELAAAWMGCLTPAEIAERLGHSLCLLTRGARTGPARHRTLRAALEWSFDLLSREEQTLLGRLAVFAAGWTVSAAEAVCSGSPLAAGQILDLLAELADKSMVVRETLPDGASRFRLLETIREYAHEKLVATGEERAVRERHLTWCLELAEHAEGRLRGPEQLPWLQQLDMELANLGSAAQWALRVGRAEAALRLASDLTLFWLVRGRMGEGLERLEASLAAYPEAASRAHGVWGAGLLAWMLGDLDRAWAAAQESLDLFQRSGDLAGTARSLGLLGMVDTVRNPPKARPALDESIRRAREAGDVWCLACSLGMLGYAAVFQGEFAAAAPALEQCVFVAREAGDLQGLRMGLLGLGWVALQRGATDSAARALEEGMDIARSLGDPVWTAVALVYLGELIRARGDSTTARAHFEEATALTRRAGASVVLAFCLSMQGHSCLRDGLILDARSLFEEVVAMAAVAGNRGNVALALLGLAEAARSLGDLHLADQRYHEALDLATRCGDKLAVAQALLGLGRFARDQGEVARAAGFCHEALDTHLETGSVRGVAETLEALAGLAIDSGHSEQAARLFGAADSMRNASGFARLPAGEDVSLLAKHLGDEHLQALWDQGAALSPEEAVAYARRGRGSRGRPRTGWDSLSRTEAQVVELAATGLTNREIGGRLLVSPRTVQTHLVHAFAKLGVSSRRDFAGLVPGHATEASATPP
jgi:predicted ATPase/DNA-binding CsgD family transcriptional regulator/Tfp pilus assembly protein PilF